MIAHPLFIVSGRQDSNLRPPGPKPGAMTGLRYAPNKMPYFNSTAERFRCFQSEQPFPFWRCKDSYLFHFCNSNRKKAVGARFELAVQLPVRQFSKLLV